MGACPCFEVFRAISRNGFTVRVQSASDRLTPNSTRYTCVRCDKAYSLVPLASAPFIVEQLPAA